MKKYFSLLSIPLGLALMFGLTSASWNNDNFIDDSFWSQNPSDEEIIDALFGSEGDSTAYMDYLCTESEMNVVTVTNSLPSLEENTIYVLDTDAIDLNSSTEILIPNCSAVISKRLLGTVITNTAQIGVGNYTVINVGNKSILDNVKVNGNKRNHNGIISEGILNNVSSYNNTQQGIRAKGKINNVKSYNNSDIGIYIDGGARINNVHSFNNDRGIEIRASYVALNNSQFNNNKVGVYINGDHNLLNNISSYNNEDYGLNFSTQYHDINIYDSIMFNNGVSFNNVYGADVTCIGENELGSYAGTINNLCRNGSTGAPSWLTMTNVIDVNGNELLDWKNVLTSDANWSNLRGNKIIGEVSLYSYGENTKLQVEPYYYVNNIITEGGLYHSDRYIGSNIEKKEGITYVGIKTAVVLSNDGTVKNYSIYGSNNPLIGRQIGIFGPRTNSTNIFSVIWGDLPYATHYTEYSVDIDAPTIEITQPSTEWARTKTVSAIASDTNPTNQTVTMYYSITTSTECNSAEAEYTLGDDILFESEDDNGKYVCFKAIDIVGNESYLVSNVIEKIDRTPPSLESKVLDETIWYTGDQQEIFTFIDTGVSLISGESTRTCTVIGEGRGLTCAITPNICDILGNCTANQEFISNSIKIDRTAPVAEISYTGYACGHGNILITVTGYDVLSGMPDEPYSFDIAGNWSTTNTKVVYTGTSGLIYIIDIAGNYSGTEYNVDWQELSPTLSNPIYNYGTKIRTYESFDLGNMVEKLGADGGICRGEQLSVVAESVSCSSGEYSLENNVLTVKPPKGSYGTVTCTITFKNDTNDIVEGTVTYDYNTYNELLLTLKPGWNVVSTPAVLSSLEFGNGGENISFSKMESGSWVSVPAITGNIIPLDGYVVNNANDDDVSMLFVYDTGVSVGNTMRQKNVDLGWNFLGITTLITPFNNIPGAVMSLDFTSYGITNLKNGVMNGGTYNLNSQSSSISNPELGEAYGVFVNQNNGIYGGVNNRRTYTND